MRHFLAEIPPATLRPGDVLITNDPWMTSGQLNDLSVVTPVFRDGRLIGFFGNTCHAIDIGGRGPAARARRGDEGGGGGASLEAEGRGGARHHPPRPLVP